MANKARQLIAGPDPLNIMEVWGKSLVAGQHMPAHIWALSWEDGARSSEGSVHGAVCLKVIEYFIAPDAEVCTGTYIQYGAPHGTSSRK